MAEGAKHFGQVFCPADTVVFDTTGGGLIGTISKVIRTRRGYVVLDSRLARDVFLYRLDGSFIRTLAGHGEGPSEYRNPLDISVGPDGNVYVLDSSLRKILCFDSLGNWQRDIFFGNLGVYPSGLSVARNGRFLLYCLHPDFQGKSRGRKIVVADVKDDHLTLRRAFGRKEELLHRFFFNFGAFGVDRLGRVWIGEVFTPTILIYSQDGKLLKIIRRHEPSLPEPRVSPGRFKACKRMAEAVDVYTACARLADIAVLRDVVLVIFFSRLHTHFALFDYCGRQIGNVLTEPTSFLQSLVIGVWDDRVYFSVEPQMTSSQPAVACNPILVGYEIRR